MDVKDLENTDWFEPLCNDVRAELERLQQNVPDRRIALQEEKDDLARQIAGWTVSLSNLTLSPAVRAVLEKSLDKAVNRQQQIEAMLNEDEGLEEAAEQALDPQAVAERLSRLDEVLAASNPSMGNIALSLHIDRIDCHPDGRVVLRTCKLGALAGAVELLHVESNDRPNDKPVKARRRARLRVDDDDDIEWKSTAEWATDPDRFAGLGEHWFEEEEFRIPEKTWPFQEMSIKVATQRLAGLTHEQLAKMHGVTVPTIRKSLRHAAGVDERFRNLPRKMERARWHEDRALEVAAKKAEGFGTNELAAHFEKSDTTIRRALNHAAKLDSKSG